MKKQLLTAAVTAGILFTSFNGSVSAHENNYTVHSGDTLWRISQINQVSISNLRQWNNLSSDTIYVNQKLSLLAPHTHDTTSPAVPNSDVTYTVKSGDTLWGIAKSSSMTVTELKTLNGLTSDNIFIGQKLQLKGTKAEVISKAQLVMDEAKKYIGAPYLWGGNTPAGFDCSGFTKYVFAKVGVTLPRTTATQWAGLTSIGAPNLGDLVFFETYAQGPSHVGIYLGANKFIHAGSSGITISDMTTSYWKPKYLGAKTAF